LKGKGAVALPEGRFVIVVLRLGHRRSRDARLTTHVCLAARAFGASAVWVAEKDLALERTVASVVERFGGAFELKTGVPWKNALERFEGVKVHLTMYGEPLDRVLPRITRAGNGRDLMLIVGSSKVPGEVYGLSDFNVAVGNQPHSEVAALALALDRLSGGSWARAKFKGAKVAIRPSARGKVVVEVAGARAEEE
jgi:tRNA (cytidine56-2'-O)-methyltransferase